MTEQYQRSNINEEDADQAIRSLTSGDSGAVLEPGTTYFVDTTGGATALILPASEEGGELRLKNVGTNQLTVQAQGADTIDGAATTILANIYDAVTLVSDEGNLWGIW